MIIIIQCLNKPEDILKSALDSITEKHCNNKITHAGYGD